MLPQSCLQSRVDGCVRVRGSGNCVTCAYAHMHTGNTRARQISCAAIFAPRTASPLLRRRPGARRRTAAQPRATRRQSVHSCSTMPKRSTGFIGGMRPVPQLPSPTSSATCRGATRSSSLREQTRFSSTLCWRSISGWRSTCARARAQRGRGTRKASPTPSGSTMCCPMPF